MVGLRLVKFWAYVATGPPFSNPGFGFREIHWFEIDCRSIQKDGNRIKFSQMK